MSDKVSRPRPFHGHCSLSLAIVAAADQAHLPCARPFTFPDVWAEKRGRQAAIAAAVDMYCDSLSLSHGVSLSRVFQKAFEIFLPPDESFRYQMLAFAAVNVIVCVILEDVIVEYFVFRKRGKR